MSTSSYCDCGHVNFYTIKFRWENIEGSEGPLTKTVYMLFGAMHIVMVKSNGQIITSHQCMVYI